MEKVMVELATYFSLDIGAETHLILYGISRQIFYPIPDKIIIHTPNFTFNNRFRMISTLRTLLFLRGTIKKVDPTSILSFGEYWNNFVLISTLFLKYPVFISDRNQPGKSLGWFHDKLRNWLYPHSRGLILQTEKAREIYLMKNKHKNIAVIGNPVCDASDISLKLKKEKIIVMVGRLIKSKHQDKLIEMFANIGASDWKLYIVGYDHLRQHNMEELQKLARDRGVEQRVVFTGKSNPLEEIYGRSSIFAFTSSSEGFPNVIGEAMMAGLPVIAFDCVAGPSEMITDGYNGYLIPLFDYKDFESKLSLLMADKNLREKFGSNGRKSIKKYSREIVSKAYFNFITDNTQVC
jgi:glycosyltransferase involved in cell wall biosynthesis